MIHPKRLMTLRWQQKQEQQHDTSNACTNYQNHRWIPSSLLIQLCIVICSLATVVTTTTTSSRHHIHNVIECTKKFIPFVLATKPIIYSILRTRRILPPIKSNGWISILEDIPRGGRSDVGDDVVDDTNNSSSSNDRIIDAPEVIPTVKVIRIRMMDGTIQKLSVPSSQWTTRSVLDSIHQSVTATSSSGSSSGGGGERQQEQSYNIILPNGSTFSFHTNNESESDDYTASLIFKAKLDELGFKHGSLVTIQSNNSRKDIATSKRDSPQTKSKWNTSNKQHHQRFDPYPELAKDYDTALRNAKIRRNTAGGLTSYSTLAALQSSLHTVEPQSVGTIQRVYMCHVAAAKFQARATTSSGGNGMALLLGTITTERKDLNQPKRARTSLSSTVESDQYCSAVRVHAIWEPQQPVSKTTISNGPSDVTAQLLKHFSPKETTNVIRVAQYLGLQPVGWIFSYSNDRTSNMKNEDGGLPVWGTEIESGARLQIEYMKKYCHSSTTTSTYDGIPRFGTLAMDAKTGATEAFQISDVAVQMVAEDMFVVVEENSTSGSTGHSRYVATRHPVIVDGKETSRLDSVLCLVNVALFSHTGMFTGPATALSNKKKRDGRLSNKTRKAIMNALDNDDAVENGDDASKIFEIISDFSILLALDEILMEPDSEQLCRTLYKWSRGQKKSVKLESQLKRRLRHALDATM